MTEYELYLHNDRGDVIVALSNVVRFTYILVTNDVSRAQIDLPEDFDETLLGTDYILTLWRRVEGGPKYLDFIGLLRYTQFTQSLQGQTTYRAVFAGLNDLLRRRIVAYAAGTAQALMTGTADDLIKEVVRDNLGSDATAARALTSKTGVTFQVQANLTQGQTITKAFSWKSVLMTLQDLADASKQAGTDVYFDVVPLDATTWEFQTKIDQFGSDRTWPNGANPLIITSASISLPILTTDRSVEVNYIYSGGQQEGTDRDIEERSDTARINTSQWNRCEGFADARHCDVESANYTACMQSAGDQALTLGRPYKHFQCDIVDTPGLRYGRDWFFGDKVTISTFGESIDVVVRLVQVTVDERGQESVSARAESAL